MSGTNDTKPSPIEIWVRKALVGGCDVTVVRPDESTVRVGVDALSMRGAERELTGRYISDGYEPVGRWQTTAEGPGGKGLEAYRTFKLKDA